MIDVYMLALSLLHLDREKYRRLPYSPLASISINSPPYLPPQQKHQQKKAEAGSEGEATAVVVAGDGGIDESKRAKKEKKEVCVLECVCMCLFAERQALIV